MAATLTMSRAYSLAAPRMVASAAASRSARAPCAASSSAPRRFPAVPSMGRVPAIVCRAGSQDQEISPNASVSISCSIDDPSSCSIADLEMLYIDALWNFYNGGSFTLTDEQYDRLREELNWQGSGFPTLRRYEVNFVNAAIAYARGESVVTDEEYEELKRKVKAVGKRDDVTALLLYTKGQQLLDKEQYDKLGDEMRALGIDVGLRGATCTISNTSPELQADMGTVAKMYTALAIIPTVIGLVPYLGATLLGKTDVFPLTFGLGFAATFGLALTAKLVDYVGLQNAEVLKGQCPCCETGIKQFFGGEEPLDNLKYKCMVCGTQCQLDRKLKLITEAGGIKAA